MQLRGEEGGRVFSFKQINRSGKIAGFLLIDATA